AVDDLPLLVTATGGLRGIPAGEYACRPSRQFSMGDKAERQQCDIATALDLRLGHRVACVCEREFQVLHRCQPLRATDSLREVHVFCVRSTMAYQRERR